MVGRNLALGFARKATIASVTDRRIGHLLAGNARSMIRL